MDGELSGVDSCKCVCYIQQSTRASWDLQGRWASARNQDDQFHMSPICSSPQHLLSRSFNGHTMVKVYHSNQHTYNTLWIFQWLWRYVHCTSALLAWSWTTAAVVSKTLQCRPTFNIPGLPGTDNTARQQTMRSEQHGLQQVVSKTVLLA
jgi:hypothetical protein